MHIQVIAEKVNPLAMGAHRYAENWKLGELLNVSEFETFCLHPIEKQVMDFHYKNNLMEQAHEEESIFNELKGRIYASVENPAAFQFTTGDYLYTIQIEGGKQYVH